MPSIVQLLRRDRRAASYTLEDMAGDGVGLLDHLGVDGAHVMGASMVLWGVTGLVMWWTLKSTRWTGAIALAGGLGAIAWLSLSLWQAVGAT